MDERLKIALQTTITRFEELRQFGKTNAPCGLCTIHYSDNITCPTCPMNKFAGDGGVGCLLIPLGDTIGEFVKIRFGVHDASFFTAQNYIQVNDRRRYINACIEFYSKWLTTGTMPEVKFRQ